jgi:hypothetical protein
VGGSPWGGGVYSPRWSPSPRLPRFLASELLIKECRVGAHPTLHGLSCTFQYSAIISAKEINGAYYYILFKCIEYRVAIRSALNDRERAFILFRNAGPRAMMVPVV